MIKSVYVLFKRRGLQVFDPEEYKKKTSDNIIQDWLQPTDEIIKIKEGKDFHISEKLFVVQRYIHNELEIPYKNVVDIEILHQDRDNLYRYPSRIQPVVDYNASIIDTCIDSELKNESEKMYVFAMIHERATISEQTNRYLFMEATRRQTFQNFTLNPFNSRGTLDNFFQPAENNEEYNDLIREIEEDRRREIQEIKNAFRNQRTFTISIFDFIRQPDLEPVRVTIPKRNDFLLDFKYSSSIPLKIEDQKTCTICLHGYEKETYASMIKTCGHLFHKSCINKWLTEYNHKCPVCRKSADPKK
jgi:hypothetical protein